MFLRQTCLLMLCDIGRAIHALRVLEVSQSRGDVEQDSRGGM